MINFFIYIDALPYAYIREDFMPFLSKLLIKNGKIYMLRNIMGYSFGIQSTILSGKLPSETMHWMPYVYLPNHSLLKNCLSAATRRVKISVPLPHTLKFLRNTVMSEIIMKNGAKIGNIPLKFLDKFYIYPYYYMNELPFFKRLRKDFYNKYAAEVRYFGPPLHDNPIKQTIMYIRTLNEIRTSNALIFIYLDTLDGVGHSMGVGSENWNKALASIDKNLRTLYEYIKSKLGCFTFMLFSDHGMCNVKSTIDIIRCLAMLKLDEGQAAYFVDATLTLIWLTRDDEDTEMKLKSIIERFYNDKVIVLARRADKKILHEYGVYREDRAYGDIIIQTRPGFMFFPNFYSALRPFKGVHGFLPKKNCQRSFLILTTSGFLSDLPSIYHIKDIRMLLEYISSL